ncbi:hypothetical protein A7J50_2558 [Pseudomonas antarctica]|uniref:Lipoprotein n=1 Tax=Pseudomonas antarctica TaxID=219572 RepID=A0A172Z0E0_9PSED|nr:MULTISPECIES: hypothetical protein [Pseudomonas]ANF85957.1 hypothetical protein A7J50_2558 [Pseudomonas antarctica]UXV22189.1 hypothetical protein N4P55_12785 [Pseudomonas fluorescens]
MFKGRLVLGSFLLLLACSNATAEEIAVGRSSGSIVLLDNGGEKIYQNIIGSKDGFSRRLISVDGRPALQVSGRFDFYYTLLANRGEMLIDCAYSDVRNNYNGARATAGMCGLNMELKEDYDEIAQGYSNEWNSSVFSFDTRSVLEGGVGNDFLLGKIGEIEVFDRYSSIRSVENSSPQKLIKSRVGCYNFGEGVGFLVFMHGDKLVPRYVDILRSESPMVFQRLQEQDLKRIAVEKCDS